MAQTFLPGVTNRNTGVSMHEMQVFDPQAWHLASIQYWQSYMYAETNKQLRCGEFCYLPATLCPFPEKVASQNSAQRKDNKVGNKTSCKKGQKKEKRRMREKNIENKSPPPKRQTLSRKTKILLISSNWQKNLLWVLKISFLAIPIAKNCSKKEVLVKNAVFLLLKWSY